MGGPFLFPPYEHATYHNKGIDYPAQYPKPFYPQTISKEVVLKKDIRCDIAADNTVAPFPGTFG